MKDENEFTLLRASDPTVVHDSLEEPWRLRESIIMSESRPQRRSRNIKSPWFLIPALTIIAALVILPADNRVLEPILLNDTSVSLRSDVSTSFMKNESLPVSQYVYEFSLSPGLDIEGSPRPVYKAQKGSLVDFELLAKKLGLAGTPTEQVNQDGTTSYQLGGLYGSSTGYFSYTNTSLYESNEFQERISSSSCSISSPPFAGESSTVLELETSCAGDSTKKVYSPPSKDFAVKEASVIFPNSEFLVSYVGPWSMSLSVLHKIGGSSYEEGSYVEISDLGMLSASGVYTDWVNQGDYPTLSAIKTLSRLNESTTHIYPADLARTKEPALQGSSGSEEPGSALGISNPASEFCVNSGGVLEIMDSQEGSIGYCTLPDGRRIEEWEFYRSTVKDAPQENQPTIQKEVIELTKVYSTYTPVWDSKGTLWLLPAWSYEDPNGSKYVAVSISDEYYIKVSTPQTPTPRLLPTPAPVSPPAASVSPPATSVSINPTPGTEPQPPAQSIVKFSEKDYLNLSLDDAQKLAAKNGLSSRLVALDGEFFAVTADYSDSRVNFEVSSDRVIRAYIG
jgi:putative hemolysin